MQTFGIHPHAPPNIHFIARTEEERTELKAHPAFKDANSLEVISLGAKFIPALNPVPWQGWRGLEGQICTLFSCMLWGICREENKEEHAKTIAALAAKGLKAPPPPKIQTKTLHEVKITAETIFQDNHAATQAFRKWAQHIHIKAKQLHDKLLDQQTKMHRDAKRQRNLHGSLYRAFYALKKYKNEIGISIADKNLGPTVYKQDLYDELSRDYLDKSGVYTRLGDCDEALKASLLQKQREALYNASKYIHEEPLKKETTWLINRMKFVSETNNKLSGFYAIIKVHKMKQDSIPIRPIQPAVGTTLEHASQWIHSLLFETVNAHPNVLKNTKSWKDRSSNLRLKKRPKLITMDVEGLYPSIDIEEGLTALRWFITRHCSHIDAAFYDYILELARIILTENYINAWPHGIYQQISGTAMGTAFAVMYAVIFMIHYEEPILEEFKDCIAVYGRYIDDGQTIWVGNDEQLAAFKQRLQTHNPHITWEITESDTHSDFLDVRTTITENNTNSDENTWGFSYNIYRKPLNTYAYLPFSSFHGDNIPKAWIKAEIFRFETLCTREEDFTDAKNFLCNRLTERGYPIRLLKRISKELSWPEVKRLKATPKQPNPNSAQAGRQKGCILSAYHFPGTKELLEQLPIKPQEIEDTYLKNICPESVMIVSRNAPSLRSHLADRRREPKQQKR